MTIKDVVTAPDHIAARMLMEGSLGEVILILEGDGPIGPLVRKTLASMLGRKKNKLGTSLVLGKTDKNKGAPSRQFTNMWRDHLIYMDVSWWRLEERTLERALIKVADHYGVSLDTARKAYQRVRRKLSLK